MLAQQEPAASPCSCSKTAGEEVTSSEDPSSFLKPVSFTDGRLLGTFTLTYDETKRTWKGRS
jgi:hypothetical protein